MPGPESGEEGDTVVVVRSSKGTGTGTKRQRQAEANENDHGDDLDLSQDPEPERPQNQQQNQARKTPQGQMHERKRRARYVLRACETCRRRKGRCNGRNPCQYCHSRSIDCCYQDDSDPESWPGDSCPQAYIPPPQQFTDRESTAKASENAKMNSAATTTLLATIQEQLDRLTAQVNLSQQESRKSEQLQDRDHAHEAEALPSPPQSVDVPKRRSISISHYHGPTSADYILNTVQLKLAQGHNGDFPLGSNPQTIPSIENSHVADDDGGERTAQHGFLQLQLILTQREMVRLIQVYEDVIGDLHPVVDIASLLGQVDRWHKTSRMKQLVRTDADDSSVTDIHDYLTLCLVLCIALAAENCGQSYMGRTIWTSVETLINARLASRATSVKTVRLSLLVGIYRFFHEELTLAWRMCGIAGRMAMELGLHRPDVFQHLFPNENQRTNVNVLLCSIMLLDRQWSAATGLPENFSATQFDQAIQYPNDAHYIKAMVSYIPLSTKCLEIVCRVGAGGPGEYEENEDTLEFLDFQIEKWRKKALEDNPFIQPRDRTTPPISLPTLLYLRANQIRGNLRRPFFLSSNAFNPENKQKIHSSLELATDTISILSNLDSSSDIYHKQHPLFQHFLTSSVALIFLIVAYTVQYRSTTTNFIGDPKDFDQKLYSNLQIASMLSAAYSDSSPAASKLAKRITYLRHLLARVGILDPSSTPPTSSSQGLTDVLKFTLAGDPTSISTSSRPLGSTPATMLEPGSLETQLMDAGFGFGFGYGNLGEKGEALGSEGGWDKTTSWDIEGLLGNDVDVTINWGEVGQNCGDSGV